MVWASLTSPPIPASQYRLSLIGWDCFPPEWTAIWLAEASLSSNIQGGFLLEVSSLSATHVEQAANRERRPEQTRVGRARTASFHLHLLHLFWGSLAACGELALRLAVDSFGFDAQRKTRWSGKHPVEILSENSICRLSLSLIHRSSRWFRLSRGARGQRAPYCAPRFSPFFLLFFVPELVFWGLNCSVSPSLLPFHVRDANKVSVDDICRRAPCLRSLNP